MPRTIRIAISSGLIGGLLALASVQSAAADATGACVGTAFSASKQATGAIISALARTAPGAVADVVRPAAIATNCGH